MNRKGTRHPIIFASERLQQAAMQENTPHSQLVESVTLAQAALLARKGKLKQAETLLLPLANRSQSRVSTLDLLAKVYAQQGKIEEAKALWLRASQIEPSNAHFRRALLRCTNLQRHKS
jgi:predicted Zn-dependent protease